MPIHAARDLQLTWDALARPTSAMQGWADHAVPGTFRDIFVCMSVEVHRDGRRIEQRWELGKKSESSNVIGNLRSRPAIPERCLAARRHPVANRFHQTTLTEVGQSPAQFDSNGTARVGGGHRGVTEIVRSLESTQ